MTKNILRALLALVLVAALAFALASCDMLPDDIKDMLGISSGSTDDGKDDGSADDGKTDEDDEVDENGNCKHKNVEWIIDRAASCKYDGLQHSECVRCGETIEANVKIEKNDEHVTGEWQVEYEPTCVDTGSKYLQCSVCKKKVAVEEIPATGIHNYFYGSCKECKLEQPVSEGFVFTSNGDKTCVLSGIGTCTDSSIIIPVTSPEGDTVISIASLVFANRDITSVIVPDTVLSIANDAFKGCSTITRVTTPAPTVAAFKSAGVVELTVNGTGTIPYGAMQGATKLRALKIEEGVTVIGENAFSSTSLASISMPASLLKIETGAFSNCKVLNKLIIGSGVTIIGERAFYDCDYLYEVYIPASVIKIEAEAFNKSPRIHSAYFDVTEGWKYAGESKDVSDPADAAKLLRSIASGALTRG